MTYPVNHFILKFPSDGSKISVIAGYPYKKMPIILRIFLSIQQYFRVKYIYLKSGPSIFSIPS